MFSVVIISGKVVQSPWDTSTVTICKLGIHTENCSVIVIVSYTYVQSNIISFNVGV